MPLNRLFGPFPVQPATKIVIFNEKQSPGGQSVREYARPTNWESRYVGQPLLLGQIRIFRTAHRAGPSIKYSPR